MQEMPARWKLRELLEKEDVTAYALAEQMGGANRRPLIYSIVSPKPAKRPENPGFKLLEEILIALESLTGKHFELDDVIERVRENPDAPTVKPKAPERES